MKQSRRAVQSVRVFIREVAILAASPLDARRLADALPLALEQALGEIMEPLSTNGASRRRPADRVASRIAEAVAARLEATP